MPTYEQLQAESWWGREIVTPELDWLGDELCRRTGRPRTAAGSKGDRYHLRGAHRSQEWILHSVYCTSRTYTVQSGLTSEQLRHIAGFDFVPGSWGTAVNRALMVEQTRRLVAAMRDGRLAGVREVIGTLDGRTVVGTRPDGSTFRSDDSHLEHWHLTLDRRRCADRALMERILAVALGEDDDVSAEDVTEGVETNRPWVSEGVEEYAHKLGMTPKSLRWLAESTWEGQHQTRAELAAMRSVVEQLAATITAGGGSVDTMAILAGVDERLAAVRAEVRDAVADLGEGGAAQVRADQG